MEGTPPGGDRFPRRTPAPMFGEQAEDFRARVAHIQAEAAAERRRELIDQASDLKTPSERIRIWERLHDVRMPRAPEHNLLTVIANDTGLSLEQVQHEQQERTRPRQPAAAEPGPQSGP